MSPGRTAEPPIIQQVRDRIAAAKARGKLVAWRYAELRPEDGMVVYVRCKLCGRGIYGKRPAGDPVIASRSKDRTQTVLQVEIEYGPLPGYQQYTIQHDDGSAHLTALCRGCGDQPLDAETLEALYLADLEQTAGEIAGAFPDGAQRAAAFLCQHGTPQRRQRRIARFDMTG